MGVKRLTKVIKREDGRPAFQTKTVSGKDFMEMNKKGELNGDSLLFEVIGSYTNKSFNIYAKHTEWVYYYGAAWLFTDKTAQRNFKQVPNLKPKVHRKTQEKTWPPVRIVTYPENWRELMEKMKDQRKKEVDVATHNYLEIARAVAKVEVQVSTMKDMVDILKREIVAHGGRIEGLENQSVTKKTSSRPKKK